MAKKYGHVNKIYKRTELRLILIESTTFSLFQPMRAGHRVNDKAPPPPPPHKLTNDPVGFNIMQALYIRFIFYCSTSQLHACIVFIYYYKSVLV